MSVMIEHYLKCSGLKAKLMDAGVISSRILHGSHGREVNCQTALDMSLCCPEEFEKDKAKAIKHGVVDYSKQDEKGRNGVRRDLTTEEVEELKYWPVSFVNDNEMVWLCNWISNDDPAFFTSKLLPNETFNYILFYECNTDGIFTIKDGAFKPTPEWKKELRKLEFHHKKTAFLSILRNSVNRILQLFQMSQISEHEDLPF